MTTRALGSTCMAALLLLAATAPARAAWGVDRSVDPCTDFDAFANGSWRAANPIPAQMSRWGRRAAARETNRRDVQDLLEALSRRTDWPRGSIERLLGDHYASCMDEAKVDHLGLTPLRALLADIDGIRDRNDLQRSIGRLHALAIPVAFGVVGVLDNHEPERFIANVVPGDLGLSSREAPEPYRARVAHVLVLAGSPESAAQESSQAILGLEKRLAQASLGATASTDPAATDHRMTFTQLQELVPVVDWGAYFAAAKLPRVDLNVAEPNFLRQLDMELRQTPLPVWKVYLRWRLLDSASPFLSKPFVDATGEGRTRAQRCLESTEGLFGDALGRKYVERYFPPAAKAKAQEIVRTLLATLEQDVAVLEWMQPATRKAALEKLDAFDAQVGYPDRWKDYAGVELHRDALWANVVAGRRFNVEENRRGIGKPTERDLWQLPPSSPDAYIDLQLNQMVLPAGFLRPPAFGLEQSDAANYGAIGTSIAHDLTHGIDAGGSELDVHGRPRPWWTEADRREFKTRGQCVSEQFEGYFIEPGLHHRGALVLSEAIGDLAGVRLAFLAFQKVSKGHPVPVRVGLTPEQQFFIAFGQLRGDGIRLEAQREMLTTDPHPVPKFRVIGPLSNLPEFQRAFACRAGAAMVRPPEKRCSVW